MTTILKEIAKTSLGLSDAHYKNSLHNESLCVDEWHCSLGDKRDELHLYKWTLQEGFKDVVLPEVEKAIYAYGYDNNGFVPYFDKDVLASLPKGYYVLIYTEDVPSWDDSDREPYTSYDVFEV